jgi:hypothetical protein
MSQIAYITEEDFAALDDVSLHNIPNASFPAAAYVLHRERGYFSTVNPSKSNEQLVFVALGEKPTGGYGIEIVSVAYDRKAESVNVVVKETYLGENTMGTEVTYPHIAIRISSEHRHIRVLTEKGAALPQLTPATNPLLNPPPSGLRATMQGVDTGMILVDIEGIEYGIHVGPDLWYKIDPENPHDELPGVGDIIHLKASYSEQQRGFVATSLELPANPQ